MQRWGGGTMGITNSAKVFIDEYVLTGNATKAYAKAFPDKVENLGSNLRIYAYRFKARKEIRGEIERIRERIDSEILS